MKANFCNRTKRQPAPLAAMLILMLALAVLGGCGTPGRTGLPEQAVREPANLAAKATEDQAPVSHYYDFLMSQLALRAGRVEEAAAFLQQAIEKAPAESALKKELALIYMKQGQEEKALELAEAALAQDPENLDALVVAASLWQAAGDPDAARQAYEKVVEKDPSRENIYLILARLHLRQEAHQKAADLLGDFVKRFPRNYTGFYYLGQAQTGLDNLDKAAAAYQRCLDLEPDLMEARAALIEIYTRQGREKDVIAQYQAVLESDPQNAAAAIELGVFYETRGQTEKARPLWKDLAGRADPESGVIKALTRILLARQRYDDAMTALSAMLENTPENSALNYLAGATRYLMDETGPALAFFRKVAADSSFYQDAMIHQAIIHNRENRPQQAAELLETAMEKSDAKAKVNLIPYLSAFYQEQKHYQQAVDLLQQGLSIDPENIELHYELGVLYDKMGDSEGAIEKMKQVIEMDPENADALNYLGYTYADGNIHLDKAESLIRRALELDPENGYIMDSMGWVYYRKGDYEKAWQYLEKAVRLVSEDPIILEHIGDVYRKINQPKQAVKFYRQALENAPEDEAALKEKIEAAQQERLQP